MYLITTPYASRHLLLQVHWWKWSSPRRDRNTTASCSVSVYKFVLYGVKLLPGYFSSLHRNDWRSSIDSSTSRFGWHPLPPQLRRYQGIRHDRQGYVMRWVLVASDFGVFLLCAFRNVYSSFIRVSIFCGTIVLRRIISLSVLEYLVEKLGIDRSKRDRLCYLLYKNYGTTLAGLRVCTLKEH